MSLHPDKLPLIQGLADGELDAANALAIETHLKSCGDCRAELARIQAIRERLRSVELTDHAPVALRTKIDAIIDAEAGLTTRTKPPETLHLREWRPPAVWPAGRAARWLDRRWTSGALAGMVAASLMLAIAMPQLAYTGTEDQLVQSHVRSLLAGHLVDVATSNRHVVKPWFNGKVDFAPPVPELADEGFPLSGGRLDYVEDHEVAAIVYRRRLHVINLFVRPARTASLPAAFATRREGYSLVRWASGGLEYWAVSDLDTRELQLFQRFYSARAKP